MIHKKRYRFTKNLDDAAQAGRCDAVCRRPSDNPYRTGSPEAAIYDHYFEKTQKILEPEDLERGFSKITWKSRTVRWAARQRKKGKR